MSVWHDLPDETPADDAPTNPSRSDLHHVGGCEDLRGPHTNTKK
jgi:hypothetical protein